MPSLKLGQPLGSIPTIEEREVFLSGLIKLVSARTLKNWARSTSVELLSFARLDFLAAETKAHNTFLDESFFCTR